MLENIQFKSAFLIQKTLRLSFQLILLSFQVSPPAISRNLLELIESGFLTSILGPALASQTEQVLDSPVGLGPPAGVWHKGKTTTYHYLISPN